MVKRLIRNKTFLSGILIVSVLTLAAVLAPLISPFAPDEIDARSLLLAPSPAHIMGTDLLGRDVFSRLIYGARISLSVGITVVLISTVIGIFLGSAAGYYGGVLDYLLMRFTDLALCFPVFFLVLSVIVMLEPSVFNIIFILSMTGWMGQARLVRAEVLSLRSREFVLAAGAYGASGLRVIVRHLIPNSLGPVMISSILGVAQAILAESALSFLGVGVQPPTPSWGNMLFDAKAALGIAWWLSFFPGLAIFSAILGYHLIAEGARNENYS